MPTSVLNTALAYPAEKDDGLLCFVLNAVSYHVTK